MEKDFSLNKSPVRENTFVSSNKVKGELSISPEVTENTEAPRKKIALKISKILRASLI